MIINVDDIQEIIETNKYLSKENNKLQSNWNSLREWLEEKTNEDWDFSTGERDACDAYDNTLDKMNELEGKDKEC